MKQILIVLVVFLAVMSVSSNASSSEGLSTTEWTYYSHYKCEVMYEYIIKKYYPSQKIWLEVSDYEGKHSFNLGKGEYIGISDVQFNTDSSVLSFIYELNTPSHDSDDPNYRKGPFLVVIKPGKVPKFYKIASPKLMSITSHTILNNKAYIELTKAKQKGRLIRVYNLEDKSFKTTVSSNVPFANVIFGEKREGLYETWQTGVIVGITPTVNPWNDNWVSEPPSIVTVFDADTGEVITEKSVDANTKVTFIQQRMIYEKNTLFFSKQTYSSEVYEQ